MLRALRAVSSIVGAVAVLGAVAPSASATDPVCLSYGRTGQCLIWAGGPSEESGGSGSAESSGGGSVHLIQVDGQWCAPAGPSDPQPPSDDPVWGGHTDGAIYDCVVGPAESGGFVVPLTLRFWSATPPVAPPDPLTLAQQAVESMNLQAVHVGIVPESRAGSVGLVGVPNWMWVEQPDPQTYGPITRSASAAGFTVTATARVEHVVWDMGDGQVITCTGPGTPYEASFGMASSPDCGHTYTAQGEYTVSATSHWVITWAGIGRTGTITMDLTRAAAVTIGEAQVVTR